MKNPPVSVRITKFCRECGMPMIVKHVHSHYDSDTGQPVTKIVCECADHGDAHGTTEVLIAPPSENIKKESTNSALLMFFRRIFGGGS